MGDNVYNTVGDIDDDHGNGDDDDDGDDDGDDEGDDDDNDDDDDDEQGSRPARPAEPGTLKASLENTPAIASLTEGVPFFQYPSTS